MKRSSIPVGILIGTLEIVALLAYTVGIAVSAANHPDTPSSPIAEVIIYLLFAAGMAAVVRGLARAQQWARTPFGVIQMFGLIVAWTVFSGDGVWVKVAGAALGLLSAGGLLSLFRSPASPVEEA